MFWQQMDVARVVEALGSAVHHVHLKDTHALVMSWRSMAFSTTATGTTLSTVAGCFAPVGEGQPASTWKVFLDALVVAGYDDVLIENEDVLLPGKLGVGRAVVSYSLIQIDGREQLASR